MLRASRMQWDLRKIDHCECQTNLTVKSNGKKKEDSLARYVVQIGEMTESIKILWKEFLEDPMRIAFPCFRISFWWICLSDFCRSLHLLVFWVLFENVMSLHRTKATFIGLLEASRVNEWIVTEKLGDAFKMRMASKGFKKSRIRIGERYVSI